MSGSNDYEYGQLFAALRRKWISREQLRSELQNRAPGDSILRQLGAKGLLTHPQLLSLFYFSAPLGAVELVSNLVRDDMTYEDAIRRPESGDLIGLKHHVLEVKYGGFGVVYICEDLVEGKKVVLKTLLPRYLVNQPDIERFRDEAMNWVGLGYHPNIVCAEGVVEHNRVIYIVTEYMDESRTLADEILEGLVGWEAAIQLVVGLVRGLHYASKKGSFFHGDLKPQNLFIAEAGAVKVTDFGLSTCQDAALGSNRLVYGTPGFIAPELFAGKAMRGATTDIYAIGAILYQTSTGCLPFSADEPSANLHRPVPEPRTIIPDLPIALNALILTCLDKEPKNRPGTFSKLQEDLEYLSSGLLNQPVASVPDITQEGRVNDLLKSGRGWKTLGHLRKAENAAQSALNLDAKCWQAHCILGGCFFLNAKFREALASYTAAYKLASSELEPLAGIAQSHDKLGSKKEAVENIQLAICVCLAKGSYADLDPVFSVLIMNAMEPSNALNFFDRITEDNPFAATTWSCRASLFRRLGRMEEALESLDSALQLNPGDAEAWTTRAEMMNSLGHFEEGCNCADRAIELDPLFADAYLYRANALNKLGRGQEARRGLDKAMVLIPSDQKLRKARDNFARHGG